MTNNKYKILFAEDDENIRGFVSALLEANGYQVILASSYTDAKTMYFSHIPDLLILDLGLPDRDGGELLREIRQSDSMPIIILSARTDESEKVKMLDAGANDYITKPFGSAELTARVRASLRSCRRGSAEGKLPGGKFRLRDLSIDYDARRVFLGENEIRLTQTEYNILAFLSENSGKMMTYSAMIKAIWHDPTDDNTIKRLQVTMANIRKKLGARPGEFGYIVNELGVGYRMDG
ncbi:MAG: response regulator transcription factor [Clostridia bacterium]|nr:response regulator transcription factor [Clostridia bacterium]